MSSAVQVTMDRPREKVCRIKLNRPEVANAQGLRMTYQLDDAFQEAAEDPDVHVIVLAGAGKHFNAGHDLNPAPDEVWGEHPLGGTWNDVGAPGYAAFYSWEREIYLDITERWRNLSKPTIAQVQGKCIAGGMMLAWACDLIVARDDAQFRDHTVAMGVCGAEFFSHPFELGVRRAKEWLFTGGWMSAQEAHAAGMVNRLAAPDKLEEATLALAESIAKMPPFGVRMAKEAINQAQDAMGRLTAQKAAFALHQLCHAHNMLMHGVGVDASTLQPALRESVTAFFERIAHATPARSVRRR